jgi:hypothetical protein
LQEIEMAGPDAVLGFHADALQFHRQRLEVLAASTAEKSRSRAR